MQPTTFTLAPSWFRAIDRLDTTDRRHVYDTLAKAARSFSSVEPHPVGEAGFLLLKVRHDGLRIVASVVRDVLVLHYVAEHDRAIRWAVEARVDPQADGRSLVTIHERYVASEGPIEPRGPLHHVGERRLQRLGVNGDIASLLTTATEAQAMEVAALLSGPSGSAIVDLLGGESFADAERRYTLATAPREEAPDELDVLVAIEDGQLDEILTEPQRRAVAARSRGALKVTGGPGTGKTVVVVHRADFLASAVFAEGLVLVTCPLASFVGPLRRRLDALCAPEVRARIEVAGLAAVAERIVAASGARKARATEAQLAALWAEAAAHSPLSWTREAYEAERAHVLDRSDVWTWDGYRAVEREGRGTRLDERGRAAVWAVIDAFERGLHAAGLFDRISVVRAARRSLAAGGERPWVAVLCDEVQDASPGELRLLAALATDPRTNAIRPDGLCLVGDGYQRVYGRPVPLAWCGIEVPGGRSRVLRVNYRTTEGIRQAAMGEIDGMDPDPFDTLEGDESQHEGYRSVRGGFPPVRRAFPSAEAELDYIAEAYLQGDGGMFVLARTTAYRDALEAGLRRRGVDVDVLGPDDDREPEGMGVTVCTFERSKGLETPRVVVAGAQLVPQPYTGSDPGERRWHEANERRLMYGAMQRSQGWLAVTRVGDPS